MIGRLVKMTFVPDKVNDFKKIFNEVKANILSCDGCKHLELLQTVEQPEVLLTFSHWESTKHLNKYRNSELFKTTWAKTKVLFADKPEAWSFRIK